MEAIVREHRAGRWLATRIATDPLSIHFEEADRRESEEAWIDAQPAALSNGVPTELRADPEAWLRASAGLPYTFRTVEIIGD